MNKHITILLTKSPYETNLTEDYHNVILSITAFFDEAKIIFCTKEACYQLYDNQNIQLLGYKNILKSIKSFKWYDIEQLYILEGITQNTPNKDLPLSFISLKQATNYINSSAHCLVY